MTSRTVAAADALPTGSRIASFEIEAVIARGRSSFVYLAQDLTRGMPVAIKEYAPARRVNAAPLAPTDPLVQRGLQAFMAESRLLAACHHPSLVRVEALLDANGTAYRVMPFYKGLSLVHVRSGLGRAPDDATLRAWGSDLVGALQAMHEAGHAHGAVSPENIMLLADDRPLLFGAGSLSHHVGSDLVESLLSDFGLGSAQAQAGAPDPKLLRAARSGLAFDAVPAVGVAPADAVADDMRALAAVLRYCISGEGVSGDGISEEGARDVVTPDEAKPFFDDVPVASKKPATPLQAGAQVRREPSVAPTSELSVPGLSDTASDVLSEGSPKQSPEQSPERSSARSVASRLIAEHQGVHADPHAIFADSSPSAEAALRQAQLDSGSATAPTSILIPTASELAQRPLIPERWHIPLWVGLIALLGIAVLAAMSYVMGAWNRMPPIDIDRSLQTLPVPASLGAEQFASASSAPAPASASSPASVASDALRRSAPLLTSPRDTAPAGAANGAQSATQTGAEKTTQEKQPERVVRRPAPAAAAKVSSPQAACGTRTNFALERCMQNQCQTKKWASHPQCMSRR